MFDIRKFVEVFNECGVFSFFFMKFVSLLMGLIVDEFVNVEDVRLVGGNIL